MKYIKQLFIILLISFIGELLKSFIPLTIPASIYGMVILFICLLTGLIKLEDVSDTGHFLIEIMPLMFIPAGVGLMSSWINLKDILFPVIVITIVTIVTVIGATGWSSQIVIRKTRGDK